MAEKGRYMELKRILKDLLHKKDISVSQLARATRVPRQTLDNWLAGQEPGSLKQVKQVANYFAVPMDYLCFGERQPERSIREYEDEINAGLFEVVLRKVKHKGL